MPKQSFGKMGSQIRNELFLTARNFKGGTISAAEIVVDSAGLLRSSNFVPLTSGYRIQNESIQFNNNVIIGAGGSIIIGAEALSGTDSQLHIHGVLEHIALFETDDPNYPDDVLVFDINSEIGRIFWYNPWPTPTRLLEFHKDGTVDLADGAALHASAEPAYLYKTTVVFTSSGTFTKADYPSLRAVEIEMVGGGGGGGSAGATAAAQYTSGGGGGGGGYARAFVLAADLDATEAVTVGAGGAAASNGNDSVFDTISGEVRAKAGGGGTSSGAWGTIGDLIAFAGVGGVAGTGDLTFPGGGGGGGVAGTFGEGGFGGRSQFSGSSVTGATNANGVTGSLYGGGGSGAHNAPSQSAHTGGSGAAGIVIVKVFV
jgi:hypothetical protein